MKNNTPKGWNKVQLEDVAEIFNGKTPSQEEKREQGSPILKIKDVTDDGKFKGLFDSFVDSDFYNRYAGKIIKNGDTLILNAAHNSEYVGSKTYFVENLPDNTIATGEWLIVRSNPEVLDSKFKHFLLISSFVKAQIQEIVKGIHLYPKDVKLIKIQLPPLSTQKKIVSILEKAERLIQWRIESNRLSRDFIKSSFSKMFLKKKYPTKKLGELALKISSGSTPLGGSKNYLSKGEIVFIRSQNVLMNKFSNHDKVYINQEIHNDMRRTWVKKYDVLLNITGASIGRSAVYLGDNDKANVNQHVCIIRLKDFNEVNPFYLNYYITSKHIQKHIELINAGGTRQALNYKQIKNFDIPIPPISLQNDFSKIVNQFEQMKIHQEKSEGLIENYFNVLMQKAFRGELIC